MGQAAATAKGLGVPNMGLAMIPGHAGIQSPVELRNNVRKVTAQMVIDNLLRSAGEQEWEREPGPRDIVCSGQFDEIQDLFYSKGWSDGSPFVPPTIEKVEAFLRYTDRDSNEVLGVVLPENRAASIWCIAVNGVMAGCKPEYLPLVLAGFSFGAYVSLKAAASVHPALQVSISIPFGRYVDQGAAPPHPARSTSCRSSAPTAMTPSPAASRPCRCWCCSSCAAASPTRRSHFSSACAVRR